MTGLGPNLYVSLTHSQMYFNKQRQHERALRPYYFVERPSSWERVNERFTEIVYVRVRVSQREKYAPKISHIYRLYLFVTLARPQRWKIVQRTFYENSSQRSNCQGTEILLFGNKYILLVFLLTCIMFDKNDRKFNLFLYSIKNRIFSNFSRYNILKAEKQFI